MKNEIRETIATLASTNAIAEKEIFFASPVKPSAANKVIKLEKHVIMRVRVGEVYENSVDGTNSGSSNSEPLPWGEWDAFPYTIKHKGQDYLRVTPVDGKPSVFYYADGEQMTKEEFSKFLTPSNARKMMEPSEPPKCLTIKGENIVHLL